MATEKEKARWARGREKRADRLRRLKDVPCKDCGNRFPPECMDFDHLGDKTDNVSLINRTKSEAVLLAEVAKCDIVCANCHRIRTHKRKTTLRWASVWLAASNPAQGG